MPQNAQLDTGVLIFTVANFTYYCSTFMVFYLAQNNFTRLSSLWTSHGCFLFVTQYEENNYCTASIFISKKMMEGNILLPLVSCSRRFDFSSLSFFPCFIHRCINTSASDFFSVHQPPNGHRYSKVWHRFTGSTRAAQ